jgi:hypothetical protein
MTFVDLSFLIWKGLICVISEVLLRFEVEADSNFSEANSTLKKVRDQRRRICLSQTVSLASFF